MRTVNLRGSSFSGLVYCSGPQIGFETARIRGPMRNDKSGIETIKRNTDKIAEEIYKYRGCNDIR